MSEFTPPPIPQSDLPTPPTNLPPPVSNLASPWIRLVAQIVDVLIAIIPVVILVSIFRPHSDIIMRLIFAAAIIGINWNFLLHGQTIGKKLLGIRIVSKDGGPIDRMKIVTHRLLPVLLLPIIPYLGALIVFVDALCIFRAGAKTLHDELAETKVVLA